MIASRIAVLGLICALTVLVTTPFVVLSRVAGGHAAAGYSDPRGPSTGVPHASLTVVTGFSRPAPHPAPHPAPVDPTLLSVARFNVISAQMDTLVARRDPSAALARLASLMGTDPAVLRSCHSLAHEIGRAAYRRYRDFAAAMTYQNDLCGSGYLHGIIEEAFQHVANPYTAMHTICTQYTAAPILGKCYHGVGHGLMLYTHNNVPLALNMCSTYLDDTARVRCSEGVFMENFNTDTRVHFSAYLRPSDPLYPCADQRPIYQGACYFYAPDYYFNLHDRDYMGALQSCLRAQTGWVATCINGVGSRTMKQNLNDPRFVERICDRAPAGTASSCIDGMVSYYLVNYYSVAKASQMCATLRPADIPSCNAAVMKRSNLFPQ